MYRPVCAKESVKDVWSFPESSIERPRSPKYFKSALFWYLLHVFLFLGCSKGSLKTARLFCDCRPPRMVAPQYRAEEICQKHNLLISCSPLQASAATFQNAAKTKLESSLDVQTEFNWTSKLISSLDIQIRILTRN